jgi:HAD superfamily hydrolase (TIGR01509 family)
MALDAVLFDVDGTLVDTNPAHVEAWRRAFESFGYTIAADRIAIEVGQGGDRLVPSVLGPSTAARQGVALRHAAGAEFVTLSRERHFPVFPGVAELFAALRDRGLRTALATSSTPTQLAGLLHSSGLSHTTLVDAVVTCDDVRATKPAPDTVTAAVTKLGLSPAQCAYVGDTPYDAQAARAAGVVALGLLTGGYTEAALLAAGTRHVWRDPAALLADIDLALHVASPGPGHLTTAVLERLMRAALVEAACALDAGEAPVGAVLAQSVGAIIATGAHEVHRSGNPTAHAEMMAFAHAAGRMPSEPGDLVLVSTRQPCLMCTGAAILAGVDTIVYALPTAGDGGDGRTGIRIVGPILAPESRALFDRWAALGLRARDEARGAALAPYR